MNWRDFFSDLFSGQHADEGKATALRPGTVMICFVNRYLEALDGVIYKIQFDGRELAGVTTATSYCFEVQPTTLNPIKVSVWSRKSKTFKALDDVVPVLGQCKLVRKVLATAKVTGRTEKHPDTKPADAPAPTLPPPPPPGPSPTDGQGVLPKPVRNEKDEPQTQALRPVPGEVTVAQLRKIFTDSKRATDAYLQSIANEVTAAVSCPVIGIGASAECDGQILVIDDMLGMFERTPRFVKRYGALADEIGKAVESYAADVRARAFPTADQTYHLKA